MTPKHMDIVGIGAINVDLIASGSWLRKVSRDPRKENNESLDRFEYGSETPIDVDQAQKAIERFGRDNLKESLGGSALLTVQALAALHIDLSLGYIGVCGNLGLQLKSYKGKSHKEWWKRRQIDDTWVWHELDQEPGLCVSYVIDGERTLGTTPRANKNMAKHLTENFDAVLDFVARAKIVHVSSFLDDETPIVLSRLLQQAKFRNPWLKISFDPGHCWIPPTEPVSQILAITDYLFLNDREFHKLAQPTMRLPTSSSLDCAELIMRQCNRGTAILHVRSYDAVSMYYHFAEVLQERRFGRPGKPGVIEDATGAGDVFSAGFLSALCAPGFSPSNGVELGLRLAQQKLARAGTAAFEDFSNVLQKFIEDVLSRNAEVTKIPQIFVGHGGDTVWKSVVDHLKARVKPDVQIKFFEEDRLAGRNVVEILEKRVAQATFAVIVMTAEDKMADDTLRARQNVIHEAGLFQGRLGNEKVVLLVDKSIEWPTNLHGVLHVSFSNRRIEDTYEDLDRALEAAGLTK